MNIANTDFQGRVAVVTGGTSGIGAATALRLAQQGATVAIVGRRQEHGMQVLSELEQHSPRSTFIQADISRMEDIHTIFQTLRSSYGRLDFAFNNAAIPTPMAPIASVRESDYDLLFQTNVKGLLFCMQEEINLLKESGNGGSIVNTSSINGSRPMVGGFAIYSTSKAAVLMLTRAAAIEEAASGIRVNAVLPGPIETAMLEQATDGNPHSFAQHVPMRRIGAPSEIADVVCWLFSNQSSYITGQAIAVDGGLLAL